VGEWSAGLTPARTLPHQGGGELLSGVPHQKSLLSALHEGEGTIGRVPEHLCDGPLDRYDGVGHRFIQPHGLHKRMRQRVFAGCLLGRLSHGHPSLPRQKTL
jgi:hypothetical protein